MKIVSYMRRNFRAHSFHFTLHFYLHSFRYHSFSFSAITYISCFYKHSSNHSLVCSLDIPEQEAGALSHDFTVLGGYQASSAYSAGTIRSPLSAFSRQLKPNLLIFFHVLRKRTSMLYRELIYITACQFSQTWTTRARQ